MSSQNKALKLNLESVNHMARSELKKRLQPLLWRIKSCWWLTLLHLEPFREQLQAVLEHKQPPRKKSQREPKQVENFWVHHWLRLRHFIFWGYWCSLNWCLLLFFFGGGVPSSLRNLSSPTSDRTQAPAVRPWSLNHGTTRKFLMPVP